MAGDYRLSGIAESEALTGVHEVVDRVRSDHPELDGLDVSMLETAAVELVTNIVEHGRPPGGVGYSLEIRVLPDRLECSLWDSGVEPVPDAAEAVLPDPLAEGGRGLALVHAAVDDLRYDRGDGSNRWTLVRRRRS